MSVTPKVYRRDRGRYMRDHPGPTVANYKVPARGVAYDAKRWPVYLGTRRDPLEGWGARRWRGHGVPRSFATLARLSRIRKAYGRRR